MAATRREVRKKKNCSEFTGMVKKLYKHLCNANKDEHMAISLNACAVLSDAIKQLVRKVILLVNELLFASKHMQAHTTSKILPAVNLLFPKIHPVTLKPMYGEVTILDELLSSALDGVIRHKKMNEKRDALLFISHARVRKLMERSLLHNKKVVSTKSGTRTTQTSIPETSPVFLANVAQAFVSVILQEAIALAKREKKMIVQTAHVHSVVRTNPDLIRFFSGTMFSGGHVMPTIHSAKV